jgi:hypothetical protein
MPVAEKIDGPLESGARPAVPEVPPFANQLIAPGDVETVTDLRLALDPPAVLAEAPLHFSDRDVDRVPRYDRAVPPLRDHLLESNRPPLMVQQHSERLERLRPKLHLGAVAKKPGCRVVEAEWSKDNIRHALVNLTIS